MTGKDHEKAINEKDLMHHLMEEQIAYILVEEEKERMKEQGEEVFEQTSR